MNLPLIQFITATVLLSDGADKVLLYFKGLPSPTPKIDTGSLSVDFVAEKDTGVDYVRKNFGIEPKIIERPRNNFRFSTVGRK